MPKVKMSLGIGFANSTHEEVIDINDDEWFECETDEQKEELMQDYWTDWSNNYIDGFFELIED